MKSQIIWKTLSQDEQSKLLLRPTQSTDKEVFRQTASIISAVQMEGDIACKRLTKEYDGINLDAFQVDQSELSEAKKSVTPSFNAALKHAMKQLNAFHIPQILQDYKVETSKGIYCESQSRPIQRVGLYIPGGNAPLVSSVLMLGVPSTIAGCPLRILCSPPQKNGKIDPNILVAANLCGIEKVYKLGGAQAIAAMAFGTESIPKVDKIFGPGNTWVTTAKMLVSQDPAGACMDLPAGPSEVMVIADKNANPEFVAADLLSQAEHGVDSQVILISTDKSLSENVGNAVIRQLQSFGTNSRSVAEQALKNSRSILVSNQVEAINIANCYAPEHLILQVDEPRQYVKDIYAAGSIFLGPWSPETAGDYASGTNHVLPTSGYARTLSGLSVRDFLKTISIQELSRVGLLDIADTLIELSKTEGLDAHRRAVEIRIAGGKNVN